MSTRETMAALVRTFLPGEPPRYASGRPRRSRPHERRMAVRLAERLGTAAAAYLTGWQAQSIDRWRREGR